jgi:hypothetical protein
MSDDFVTRFQTIFVRFARNWMDNLRWYFIYTQMNTDKHRFYPDFICVNLCTNSQPRQTPNKKIPAKRTWPGLLE